jgi:transposase
VCRPRCAQEARDGLCAGTRHQRGPGPACAHLRHHDDGTPDAAGLARGSPGESRGDGEYRRVLATRLLRPRRDRRLYPGQRDPDRPGPARKTDVNDAAWIAQLLELRDLTRYRKLLIQERTRHANRLHKVLEDAGIKLTSVATRLLGASGRAMLDALVSGTTDPIVLADLARGKLRKKLPALRQALLGHFRAHHAFLVSQLLAHLDYLDEAIETVSTQIDTALAPFAEELARLDTIRGVNKRTAEVLLAELGPDMRVFPTAKHAARWAGLCPGNHESAGKHRSGRTRHGNRWLRAALIEAALAASVRSTTGAFAARYRRVRHRGHKKAIVAVAHAILVTVYHLLARQTTYQDPGADYYDRRHVERVRHRAIQTLERQGYRVTLEPAA